MNNNDLISVIIPIYNAEKELNRCIESIVHQTYKNLEIILVNDGSVDSSLSICEDWKKRDGRIKIISQKNAGVSAARNAGLQAISGLYFTFVDADDWVEQTYCEKLLDKIVSDEADMAFCKINYFYDGAKCPHEENGWTDIISNKNAEHFLIGHNDYVLGSADRILYRSNVCGVIRFDVNLHIYEDLTFLLNCLNISNKLSLVNECLYNYDLPQTKYFDKYYRDDIIDICYKVGISLNNVLIKMNKQDWAAAELFKEYCLAVNWILNCNCDKRKQFKILKSNALIDAFRCKKNYLAYKRLYSCNKFKLWLIRHKYFSVYLKLISLKRCMKKSN